MAIDRSLADRAAALAQNMRYILGGQMPAAAAFKQRCNQFALLCVVTHKKHLFELRQKTEEIFRRKLNLRIVFNFNPESAVCQERNLCNSHFTDRRGNFVRLLFGSPIEELARRKPRLRGCFASLKVSSGRYHPPAKSVQIYIVPLSRQRCVEVAAPYKLLAN